jgi:2-polyprenyl-3-methyl-5-hydroxy-6-metoxy-1,4-benzoquinol methylase
MPFESSPLFKRGIKAFRDFVYLRLRTKRQGWEGVWSQEGYSPYWKIKRIPKDIKDAVDSGWFPPGAGLLDIGCGSGEIAAWLAEQGFEVLGVDFAKAAINLAKSQHHEAPGSLEFKVMDICRGAHHPARFSALLGRGCFHHLPKRFLSA